VLTHLAHLFSFAPREVIQDREAGGFQRDTLPLFGRDDLQERRGLLSRVKPTTGSPPRPRAMGGAATGYGRIDHVPVDIYPLRDRSPRIRLSIQYFTDISDSYPLRLTGGPFLLCQGGGLLARRAAGRVSILRQDSTAVGGGHRDLSQHAGGPFLLCQRGGLLARRAAGRVGIRRQDSTAVGGGHRDLSQHARGLFLLCQRGGLLARRAGPPH
jgi:hypothetical protein